jgi:drug/metabolite transporter (DMT)-like permease
VGWIALSLLSAAFVASGDAVIKRATHQLDAYALSWGLSVVAAALLWPVVLVRGELPPFGPMVLGILAGSAVLNILRQVLIVKSLETADLSIVGPLLGTTPMFLLLVSPVLLGETASWIGGAGVVVTVAGSYVLCMNHGENGILRPFRAFIAERGPRLVLMAAAVSALTAAMDKTGLLRTSPLAWSAAIMSAIALGLTPVALSAPHRRRGLRSRSAWSLMAIAGTLLAAGSLSLMLALEIGLAAYVIALKRVSGPLSVLLGRAAFQEGFFVRRLIGSAIIVGGVLLIALA